MLFWFLWPSDGLITLSKSLVPGFGEISATREQAQRLVNNFLHSDRHPKRLRRALGPGQGLLKPHLVTLTMLLLRKHKVRGTPEQIDITSDRLIAADRPGGNSLSRKLRFEAAFKLDRGCRVSFPLTANLYCVDGNWYLDKPFAQTTTLQQMKQLLGPSSVKQVQFPVVRFEMDLQE